MTTFDHIIVAGRNVPCAAPVVLWEQHGLTFRGLSQRTKTRVIVTHWTGAENPPDRVFRTLIDRRLSVQFCVSATGEIWQYCDADLRCSHAGIANAYSVGIEIVNAAGARPVPGKTARVLLRERIHGDDYVYTAFTPAQVRSALALIAALCEAYALPMTVPLESVTMTHRKGEPSLEHAPVRRVIPRALEDYELASFRGVMGHFHVSELKRDPGIALLEAVAAFEARHEQGIGGPAE